MIEECTCSEEWVEKCTPPDGARCHCGEAAEWRSPINAVVWCMSCKFGVHPTCECSRDEETE